MPLVWPSKASLEMYLTQNHLSELWQTSSEKLIKPLHHLFWTQRVDNTHRISIIK